MSAILHMDGGILTEIAIHKVGIIQNTCIHGLLLYIHNKFVQCDTNHHLFIVKTVEKSIIHLLIHYCLLLTLELIAIGQIASVSLTRSVLVSYVVH